MTRFAVCTNQLNTIITVSVIFWKSVIFSALSLKHDLPPRSKWVFFTFLSNHSITPFLMELNWLGVPTHNTRSKIGMYIFFESIACQMCKTQVKNNYSSKFEQFLLVFWKQTFAYWLEWRFGRNGFSWVQCILMQQLSFVQYFQLTWTKRVFDAEKINKTHKPTSVHA